MTVLSQSSLAKLQTVVEPLRRVVLLAATRCEQPFSVLEGSRSQIEQFNAWKRGASKLNGLPIGQSYGDGTPGTGLGSHQSGRAVDLVPLVNSTYRWEWPLIYPIALSMLLASRELLVQLRWGGVWDRLLTDLPPTVEGLRTAVSNYCTRHEGPDFLDGPHYEIHSSSV